MKNITKGRRLDVLVKPESFERQTYASEEMVMKELENYFTKIEIDQKLSKKADKTELNNYVTKSNFESWIESINKDIQSIFGQLNLIQTRIENIERYRLASLEERVSALENKEN